MKCSKDSCECLKHSDVSNNCITHCCEFCKTSRGHGNYCEKRISNNESLMQNKKYVFVCGLHRSGTTPLQKILGQSPIISKMENTGSMYNEGQHNQSVYKDEWKFGGPGCFANNEDYHYTNKCHLLTKENNSKIIVEWAKYWDLSKQILLEKSPPNLIHTLYLQELVTKSYFIVIIRHPFICSMATINQSWSKEKSIDKYIQHWLKAHQIFFEDKPFIKKYFLLHYEKIENDSSLAEKLSEFLEEDFEKSKITFDKFKNTDSSYLEKYPINSEIIEKYEKSINVYGYSFLPPYYLSVLY